MKEKNVFIVVTTDKERLRKHGQITYETKLNTNLVILKTNKSLERIRRVGGVISAEESMTGHLCA